MKEQSQQIQVKCNKIDCRMPNILFTKAVFGRQSTKMLENIYFLEVSWRKPFEHIILELEYNNSMILMAKILK